MRKFTIILLTAIYAITISAYAQNYDEAKVGNYPLPDPLTFTDGKKVKNKKQWAERREEILDIFQKEMYGQMPAAPEGIALETIEQGKTLGGYATQL